MTHTQNRLSEQDLAQLYMQTEAALKLDDLLQGKAHGDPAQIAVHDSISDQTPDLALISLSLCGLVVLRDFPIALKDGYMGPVLRELIVVCEDNLLSVGRLWLDSVCHQLTPDPIMDRETIESIPDRLRIMASIFFEMREALEDGDHPAEIRKAVHSLLYQSESHADLADRFVEKLKSRKKKPKAQTRPVPDQIPLPYELVRPRTGAEVVHFSLFAKPRPTRH